MEGWVLWCVLCRLMGGWMVGEGAISEDMVVDTENGRIRGLIYYATHINKQIYSFLGIPFAKPPLHHLRFRHPQAYGRWEGVYNASKLPNSCIQVPDLMFGKDFAGSNIWNPTTKVSEDCLYLNIWVPYAHPRLRKAAVMVWIHGGGFYAGTPTLNVYDGKALAGNNSVIVVSIAYRLGVFGFLSLNHPSAPGNAGIFDQLMALEWIQKNIRHFGGDPENITLFGESAGAVSASLHLFSPLSHSKFQRVILQSGVANMPWATLTMPEAKERSLEFSLNYIGCSPSDDMSVIADCLRSIPAKQLLKEQYVTRGVLQFPFLPVIDGVFLADHPLNLLRTGNFKRCPVLLGSNANEGSYFIIYELTKYIDLDRFMINYEQYRQAIHDLFYHYPQYNKTAEAVIVEAIKFQYTNWLQRDNSLLNARALDAAISDYHFICPTNLFALYYSLKGENVYMYHFTQRYTGHPWPEWMGVLHGDEIMFVFGDPLRKNSNFSGDDKRLSAQIMNYWSNFAKTGDPNQTPGVRIVNDWPLYTPSYREYLELNSQYLKEENKLKAIGRGPRIAECAFWEEFIPVLQGTIDTWKRKEDEWSRASVSSSKPSTHHHDHFHHGSVYFLWGVCILCLGGMR